MKKGGETESNDVEKEGETKKLRQGGRKERQSVMTGRKARWWLEPSHTQS